MNTCSCSKGTLRPCLLRASSARHCSTTPEYAVGLSSGLSGQAKGMSAAGQQKRKRATSPPSGESSSTENDSGRAQGAGCRRSCRERNGVERYVPTGVLGKRVSQDRLPTRFHITPMNEWEWLLRKVNLCVRNRLEWRNGTPLPTAPAHSCWLLPCKDDTAVEIAKHQDALRALGWKVLTCQPHVVSRIGQKANLHAYAKSLNLLEHLPQHYSSPDTAKYPCMLKAAVGEHGKDVFIVHSAAEVRKLAVGGFPGSVKSGRQWLLQEIGARCPAPNGYVPQHVSVE